MIADARYCEVQMLKNTPSPSLGVVRDHSVLVIGGTGSLGTALVEQLLSGRFGMPGRIVVFSRDEAKQHALRLRWGHLGAATDDAIWRDSARIVQFRVGDIRDPESVAAATDGIDTIVHAAALKQVPTCEYFPEEAIRTNVTGAENLVRAVRQARGRVRTVIGISTDKAVKPVNVMGMTKSMQERVLVRANLDLPECRFALVRYGNVLASRGSIVPLFVEQASAGRPLTVTDADMTRFLISIDDAVAAVIRALAHARRGETLVPILPAARIMDLARAIGGDEAAIILTGTRPGEKLHEVLVSEEERHRTVLRGDDLFVAPILPELRDSRTDGAAPPFVREYSSDGTSLDIPALRGMLTKAGILPVVKP